MKNYHITFYFSDKINLGTNISSELELDDFVQDFNSKLQQENQQFVNFIGDEKKSIN